MGGSLMIVAAAEHLSFWPGRATTPALDGVDLEIREGEILLMQGPSGGGKSTLLRAFAGLVPHFHGGRFAGRVVVAGHDTRVTTPAVLAGVVGSVFQDPEAHAVRATVWNDVAFGMENLGVAPQLIPSRVREVLDLVAAGHLHDRAIDTLSGGERQRVAIAGALALRPRLLLLDEPTSQLDDRGVRALGQTVERLAGTGVAVLIAEHHAERLAAVADRRIVLTAGRLGGEAPDANAGAPAQAKGDELLRVQDVVAGYGQRVVITNAVLSLATGSVTALHGANGSGKSTLARVIAGLHAAQSGQIMLAGTDVTQLPTEQRSAAIGFLPQDAGRWLLREHVRDELAFAAWRVPEVSRDGLIDAGLAELDLTRLADAHPLDLSVGERERVALAAVLVSQPQVIVLDEPSRGMDPARRALLAQALRSRTARGAAVLIATHDAGFAEAIADRHVEIVEGHVIPHTSQVVR
jgi:energy-coupling factor transport system ATP-binding protein